MEYEFGPDWFSPNIPTWNAIFKDRRLQPKKILEIGSFEGRSTVWIIDNLLRNGGEIYCVDTWEGGREHDKSLMAEIERRFEHNTRLALANAPEARLHKRKGDSGLTLARLLADGHGSSFDFVYVDGSHETPDVLIDLSLSFRLCGVGGLIACDDYTWFYGEDPRMTPKLAIDSFVNCFSGKLEIVPAWLYQVYFIKRRE